MNDDETGSGGRAGDPASRRRYLIGVGIEERWAPLTGRAPGRARPAALRRRWLAAPVCFALLALVLWFLS